MNQKEEWLVLVVSEGGHLIPTPEDQAPRNTKYVDENGVIRDIREIFTGAGSEGTAEQDETAKQQGNRIKQAATMIRDLLENQAYIRCEYNNLLALPEEAIDISGLTVRAVDYSRSYIQIEGKEGIAHDVLINLIDRDAIRKEEARQKAQRLDDIAKVKEKIKTLDSLKRHIARLRPAFEDIALRTYYPLPGEPRPEVTAENKAILNRAIRELAEFYVCSAFRAERRAREKQRNNPFT